MNKKKKKSILPNKSSIINIESYKDSKGNLYVKEKDGYFELPFYLDQSIFYNMDEYNRFIKAVEKMVRTSDYYKEYIACLKLQYGFNHCMILGNIDDEDISIEMHHAIITLYDVVSIITNDMLFTGKKVSSFRVCDTVLKEHFEHNIPVIMVSKTVHELIHKGKIFINPKQCIGDLNSFLENYNDGITKEMADGINKYLALGEQYETTDNGLLRTTGIKSWSRDEDLDNIMKD